MRDIKNVRGLLNEELAAVVWSECDAQAVRRAAENGGRTTVKKRMVLALAMLLSLALMTTSALAAAGLLFSPRYDALQLADQALLDTYGITEEMHPALTHTVTENDGAVTVTYEMADSEIMRENRFGAYTVTVREGKAEASWTMDGMDVSGGLEAPAWGAEQLLMYVQHTSRVAAYMEFNGMLMAAPQDDALWQQQEDKRAQDKQTALSMAQITLADADAIGREAIAARYGLSAEQASLLVRYTNEDGSDFEDESTYEMAEGRPLVNLHFHLTQQPGHQWEKDGLYIVTVNLLDGTVEDISYDPGVLGNG